MGVGVSTGGTGSGIGGDQLVCSDIRVILRDLEVCDLTIISLAIPHTLCGIIVNCRVG